ncbi:hypothetical protein BKA62DRAFT_765406 [Auriculariales sp. MPI-PUGE-AT-0066]|nr:hypothetical protein BKA62DRAFT_765406 [Auriculariales sp. MPI-PUGE-AT-0066]
MDPPAGPPAQSSSNSPSASLHTGSGAGAQIRSRITVVCAECKRLKLKCDRRVPCGSCVKRDTVNRCTYSAAAAEKIDVQSLHNRVLLLESQVQTLAGGSLSISTQPTLDRAPVIITGGSSVIVNLEDIASVWLEQLDFSKDLQLNVVNEADDASISFFETKPFPDIGLFRSPDYDRPTVTPMLLDRLPPENMREALLDQFLSIMLLRPSFNFPHFRHRVQTLFTSPPQNSPPSSLSFFACVALGFALGAQAWLETNKAATISTPAAYDPEELFALADHSIQIYERIENAHDVDYITALILQVLFLIHDGKPRVDPRVSAIVGKMVVAARDMGLGVDPDDTPGKYSPFEAEMRRRAWWDVYFYDLFISDFLGHLPIIADNSFTTNMLAECDDELFSPQSTGVPPPGIPTSPGSTTFFILKCKLAQLVKNMKKRVFTDPKQPALEPSLEMAQTCESEITQWLNELEPAYRLDMDPEPGTKVHEYLVAQRSELSMIANSLMLKIFHPFVKRSYQRSAHHAMYASISAAHKIVLSAERLQTHMKGPKHALAFMSYFFNVQLFHAAVICANSCIQEPTSIYAKECMRNLIDAMRIMRDPVVPSSRGPMRGGVEGSMSEPLRVLELMQRKAEETARGSGFNAGMKRKHSELDEHIEPGFHIPYAGPTIVTTSLGGGSSGPSSALPQAKLRHSPADRSLQPASLAPAPPPIVAPAAATSTAWTPTEPPPASPSSMRIPTSRSRAGTHTQYPAVSVRNRNNDARRGSVGSSNRPSGSPGSSSTSGPRRATPPSVQATTSFTPPQSGPPSASATNHLMDAHEYTPVHGDSSTYFMPPMPTGPSNAPTTFTNSTQPSMVYSQQPSPAQYPPQAPQNSYYMPPPVHQPSVHQYHPATSQAMYDGQMYTPMDSTPAQSRPSHHPPQVSAHYAAPTPQDAADGSEHEADRAFNVPSVWSAGNSSRYQQWSQQEQQYR